MRRRAVIETIVLLLGIGCFAAAAIMAAGCESTPFPASRVESKPIWNDGPVRYPCGFGRSCAELEVR